MDFSLSDDQRHLYDEIAAFASAELNVQTRERDRDGVFAHDLWRKCGEKRLQGLPVPPALGGRGLDPLSCALALEALGYGCRDSGLVFAVSAHLLSCVVPLWKHGTPEQQARYLPGLCDGSLIGVHAMTEPDSGSDAFALRTTAVADGAGYRLRGTKTYVSNGPVADLVIVFALTDAARGYHGGVTAFLVEARAPGFRAQPAIEKMGLRTVLFDELLLEDVWVPAEAVLGGVGGGSAVFTQAMDWERTCLFAGHVGTMQRLLEQAVRRARTRTQFGQAIGKFQAVSHRLADMKVRLEAARLLVYRAAWRLERTRTASLDAAMAKLFVSESLVDTAMGALHVHGGAGYTAELELERAVRDAVGSTIYSGTSEMQRTIIARWLGL